MPNPKRKHTRSRRDSRRSQNWKLETLSSSACPQCGKLRASHVICPSCGFYNGKLVIAPKTKKDKSAPPSGDEEQSSQ